MVPPAYFAKATNPRDSRQCCQPPWQFPQYRGRRPNGSIVLNFAFGIDRCSGRPSVVGSVCFCFEATVKQVKSNGHCVFVCVGVCVIACLVLCLWGPAPGASFLISVKNKDFVGFCCVCVCFVYCFLGFDFRFLTVFF